MSNATPGQGESIGELLSRVVADARQVVIAEIDVHKAKLFAKVAEARSAAILLLASLVIGSLALTGLVVGALLSLSRFVGPVWATVIVVGSLSIGAALCGWLALRHFRALVGTPQGGA